ncbi:DMT family transporter [Falsirhodobacter halotolerans]|uniref:DMT family transporter n=1 Tax=Falsirhodobacter halotolerans TaxID=1146892 RepID=UPI001FD39E21|nr:DMT family transporter [Falsirhodobacter halotolerans]MCJ8139428.1 DMT family transporter [Falsirhodobacter halotolerans]
MIAQRSLSGLAWAQLLGVAVLWGGSFLTIRLALNDIGPHWVVAYRCLGAFVILAAYVALRRMPVPWSGRFLLSCLALGVLGNIIPFSLITWAQITVPSGLASILNASTALFGVVVAAIAFADERLTPRRLIGVAVGFAGVITVIGPSLLHSLDPTSFGQLALIGSSISYAIAGSLGRVIGRGVAPQILAAGMLGGSAVVGGAVALITEGGPPMPGATSGLAILYLAVMATAVAYLVYYKLLATAGAGNTSLVTLLVAPLAVLLGALVLEEALPARAFAGFAGIAIGLLILDGRILSRIPLRRPGKG